MAKRMTAEDVLALVAGLPPKERLRLLRLMATAPGGDAPTAYAAAPPHRDEFAADGEPLAWDAEGWEKFD